MTPNMQRFSLMLTPEEIDQLKAARQRLGMRSMAEVVRSLIAQEAAEAEFAAARVVTRNNPPPTQLPPTRFRQNDTDW